MHNMFWRYELNNKVKPKKTRVTLDLSAEDYGVLQSLMGKSNIAFAEKLRKAMRVLKAIENGECRLVTPKGEKIPNSVIFS